MLNQPYRQALIQGALLAIVIYALSEVCLMLALRNAVSFGQQIFYYGVLIGVFVVSVALLRAGQLKLFLLKTALALVLCVALLVIFDVSRQLLSLSNVEGLLAVMILLGFAVSFSLGALAALIVTIVKQVRLVKMESK